MSEDRPYFGGNLTGLPIPAEGIEWIEWAGKMRKMARKVMDVDMIEELRAGPGRVKVREGWVKAMREVSLNIDKCKPWLGVFAGTSWEGWIESVAAAMSRMNDAVLAMGEWVHTDESGQVCYIQEGYFVLGVAIAGELLRICDALMMAAGEEKFWRDHPIKLPH